VPYVSTAAEAAAAVSYIRYPPAGVRGVAGTTRASRFGRVKDYATRAHEEICLLVQVETQRALDELEAICAVEGVDGVFIGPADLHASLGHTGEIANPEVKPLIASAARRRASSPPARPTPATGSSAVRCSSPSAPMSASSPAARNPLPPSSRDHETRDHPHCPGSCRHHGHAAKRVHLPQILRSSR
jgi:hypothetical protein